MPKSSQVQIVEPKRPKLELRPQLGPQEEFLSRGEDEVLYGGAKGGGKSYALLLAATRQIHMNGYRAIIFRRTYPKLKELIERSHTIFPGMGGTWNGATHTWRFETGATIAFGHVQHENDKLIYQGHEYHFIGFDQLEEFTESQYLFLSAQSRSSVPGVYCEIRSTANPGGIGHAWVFKRFMMYPDSDIELAPRTVIKSVFRIPFHIEGLDLPKEITRTRVFIPATVYDNKILLRNDPGYLATLNQLPERERQALLDGNWKVFAGQYFAMWDDKRHIIEPFTIPEHWVRFICFDYGSSAPAACYWCAVDEEGKIYVYKEYYAAGNTARISGKEIKRISTEMGEDMKSYAFRVADPAIFPAGGRDLSIAAEMAEEGVLFEEGSNSRLSGWNVFKQYLGWSDDGENVQEPRIVFFKTCYNAIRTIPGLIHDDHNVEDLNTDGEDHAADALRYGIVRLKNGRSKEAPGEDTKKTHFGIPMKVHRRNLIRSRLNQSINP